MDFTSEIWINMRKLFSTPTPVIMLFMLICAQWHIIYAQIHQDKVQGVEFGYVYPTLIEITPGTGLGVLYMEEDLYIPGNILYIEGNALKTYSPLQNQADAIAGLVDTSGHREGIGVDARFYAPESFHQPSRNQVIVTDSNNGCFRSVSRLTNGTSKLAGICSASRPASTEIDGQFMNARFGTPAKKADIDSECIAVTDTRFGSIRLLNFTSEEVSLLVKLQKLPVGLALRPGTRDLFFSFAGGIGYVNLDSSYVKYLFGENNDGYKDGSFAQGAMLSRRPESLFFLTPSVILLTDLFNNAIRVVDLRGKTISSVCGSGAGSQPGDIESCKLRYPRSLLRLTYYYDDSCIVMIGLESSIGHLECWVPDITTTTTIRPTTSTSTTTSTSATTQTSLTQTSSVKTKTTSTPTTTTIGTTTTSTTTTSTTTSLVTTTEPTTTSTKTSTTILPPTSTSMRPLSTKIHIAGTTLANTISSQASTSGGQDAVEIVGIIVGGLVFVAMIVAGTIYLVCKRRSKTGSAVHQHTPTFNMPKDDCEEDAYQSIDEYEEIPSDLCTDFDLKLASEPQQTRKMNVYNQQNSENDATQATLRKGLCSSIDHYSRPRTENEYVSIYKEHYMVPSKDDAIQEGESDASVARQNQTGFRESMPIDPAPSAPSTNSVEYMCLQQNDSTEDNHYTIAEECSEAAKQVADDYV